MSVLQNLGTAINAYQTRAARSDRIARLQRMSDSELSAMGVSRDRIYHHVYRDIIGL